MKKNILILFCLPLTLFMISCQKDEEVLPIFTGNPMEIINMVNIQSIYFENGSMKFYYGNDGRLSKVEEYLGGGGETDGWTSETTYLPEYHLGRLTKIIRHFREETYYEGETQSYLFEDFIDYSYNDHGQVQQIRIVEDGFPDEVLTREYNDRGVLVRQISDYEGFIWTNTYEWAGKNISKSSSHLSEGGNARLMPSLQKRERHSMGARVKNLGLLDMEVSYSDYDSGINPFQILLVLNPDQPLGQIMSYNNPRNIKMIMYDNGEYAYEWLTQLEYHYDSNGFPNKVYFQESRASGEQQYLWHITYKP